MGEDKVVGRLARQAGAFARGHGGAKAVVQHLGERGARIVLVGEDGAWGDLVAPSPGVARQAVEAAGLPSDAEVGDFRTGPYEWSRMAGVQIGGRANT